MFKEFAIRIEKNFTEMSKHELFVVTTENADVLWQFYLDAFPTGTNLIYKANAEHDCNCCKGFIKNIGNVVAFVDGRIVTIWDNTSDLPFPYDVVSEEMREIILSFPITGIFRKSEHKYGAKTTRQLLENNEVKSWDHLYCNIDSKHFTKNVDEEKGVFAATYQVFKRGLDELTRESLFEIVDLINSNSLYRGAEHLSRVLKFREHWETYHAISDEYGSNARSDYVWKNIGDSVARFRNTVIGTLAIDLSKGVDTEIAIRSFENKVAPTNYKRPTAIITPMMVNSAMTTIEKLGLEPSLQRRFAKISDITINNVLWADNSVKANMKPSLSDILMKAATVPSFKTADISIEEFMRNVLPAATSIKAFVSNSHLNNFVSLTAPAIEDTKHLFKWNNDFGWSYNGELTDSIKERVKRAGGNTEDNKLRVSLAWYNYDDLDISAVTPARGIIDFRNKAGVLDVDMNAGYGKTREAVENLSWKKLDNGDYCIRVHNFSKRESIDTGFEIEIEANGETKTLSYPNALPNGNLVEVALITVMGGEVVKILTNLESSTKSKVKWRINTEALTDVETVMYSPNYWDDNAVGNKHWFFMLKGCKNDMPVRGIYNEFLNGQLDAHRRVFEVLGSKTKCQPTDEQLSGIGFSSTKSDKLRLVVNDKLMYNVKFS